MASATLRLSGSSRSSSSSNGTGPVGTNASGNAVQLTAAASVLVAACVAGVALGSGYVGWLLCRRQADKEIASLASELAVATETLATRSGVSEATSAALGAIDGFALPSTPKMLPSGWVPAKREKAGTCCNVMLAATLPYTMQPNDETMPEMLLTSCNVYCAPSIRQLVHDILRSREVSGLPGKVTFGQIVSLILNKGASRIYVYGGFLRDALSGKVGDDLDFLLRSTGGSIVPFLRHVCEGRSWPFYMKSDEKTGASRWDFICMGDKEAKMKFSAHPCGSGCEGDFCCNTLLYDVHCGALIDPTGKGIQDSVNFVLRHNRADFASWIREDRLRGMKLLRYYNFVGRGFSPASQEFRADIVAATFDMLNADDIEGQTTVGVFFKRKIFRAELGVRGALKKEASFRESIFKEMIKAGRSSSEAVNFYLESIAYPNFGTLMDRMPGTEGPTIQALRAMAQREGCPFSAESFQRKAPK